MESKTTKHLELTLNETETKWLKDIMQNPLFVDDPNDEHEIDKDMRRRFWNALQALQEV